MYNTNKLYNTIAEEITGNNPYLQCTECGRKINLSKNKVAERLQNGWEKCCGYTMRYYKGDKING